MTQQPTNPHDMQAMIAASVAEALEQAGLTPGAPAPGVGLPDDITFKDLLAEVDPRDSQAGIAMLDWLLKTDRLRRIGVLDGGQGYMFIYEEPKGSTNAGHRPGGTQGDRIVDSAIEGMEEKGAKQVKTGLCPHCMSAVQDDGSGMPILVDDEAEDRDKCPANGGGPHDIVS